jgi:hypothetical protein
MFGNIFLFQIHQMSRKVEPRMQFASFFYRVFSGCSTTKDVAAHILGRPILGQSKAGIQACIVIKKKDDDRRGSYSTFEIVQKAIGEVMCGKEEFKSGKK